MTTDLVFVDTNVFLYARDDREPAKLDAAAHWLTSLANREILVVSPQVLGEYLHVTLRGKLPITAEEARQATLEFETYSRGALDLELIQMAWSLRQETSFQWWDCAILGAAIRAGCRYLLTEDF
ncbi:PIN domain-containing protein [Methylobacterium komagatae]|uniref:PIN domain-containing protein n=1 Tax=Methylobacterium komagatae TaxID=374425 RepID=A0ABW2BHQ0_9HYPH